MLSDVLIIFLLILLNGVFAMAELSVFSSRRPLLTIRAEGGNRGARVALQLAADPGPFLSTVQIGITLISILSGAYGGATLADPVALWLSQFAWVGESAHQIALMLVVGSISYVSLTIGELIPKRLALSKPEAIACVLSRPMKALSRAAHPFVVVLDATNRLVLKLMGISGENTAQMTQEEVKAVIAEGTESGALDSDEQSMLESVLRLDQLSVKRAMTPRQDVVWIDTAESMVEIGQKIRESRHSRYVLCDGGFEHIVGVVTAKDMLAVLAEHGEVKLVEAAQVPIMLPDTASMMAALAHFRRSTANIALIFDEYGGFEGILTFKDILEVIVGALPEGEHYTPPAAKMRDDGSWLIDGLMPLHEVEATLGVKKMDDENAGFHTLAGFMMHRMQHIPTEGEHIDWQNMRFEVVDMDGNRVDKILVVLPQAPDEGDEN